MGGEWWDSDKQIGFEPERADEKIGLEKWMAAWHRSFDAARHAAMAAKVANPPLSITTHNDKLEKLRVMAEMLTTASPDPRGAQASLDGGKVTIPIPHTMVPAPRTTTGNKVLKNTGRQNPTQYIRHNSQKNNQIITPTLP